MIDGMINVCKEKGFTSHDVVAKLRGILKQKKIGHTGTLDPDAVGVLPVCLGKATKLCDMIADKDKVYEAVMRLGETTDTQDISGTVLHKTPADFTVLSKEAIEEAALSFVGDYDQLPPMYSAIKVGGKKLYELARAGVEVERKPRRIKINSLRVNDINLEDDIKTVTITVDCSKGTYIRTLCHDIGQKLGCGGTMKSLKRTRVGIFTIDGALKLSQLEELAAQGRLEEKVIPVEAMFTELPALTVKDAFARLIENGNAFYPGQAEESVRTPDGGQVRVYDRKGRFYGIYAFSEEKERYQPVKMFL